MRRFLLLGAALSVSAPLRIVLFLTGPSESAAGECGALSVVPPPPTYAHVIWIWMENKSYKTIIGNPSAPYLNNTVAPDCGLATNYFNASHPSTPNYLAATSGSTNGVSTDCLPKRCPDPNPSIFGQLEAAGMSWRSYEESMPSNCYKSNYPTTAPVYVPRHNPAVYYNDAASSCLTADIPMGDASSGAFATDLANGTLPNFSFVTPNLTDDMHSGTQSGRQRRHVASPMVAADHHQPRLPGR
jgi:hypothetical protein